jgi:hypothetical protein
MFSRKLLLATTVLALTATAVITRAQDVALDTSSPPESVADAARKARAHKKDSVKPAKVFTDDNVGDIKGQISVVGAEPVSQADASAAKKEGAKPANASEGKKDETYWQRRFAAARKALADDTREVDILQREFNLKQEQFYQDPTVAMKQQNSREDLDKTQSQIDAKKLAVERDNQAISDLEDDLRRSGGEPGWANEPSGAGPSDSSSSETGNSGSSGPEAGATGTDTSGSSGTSSSNSDSSKPL